MVDLVAKTVLLLLVDTTVSIDRLKMTKENHKLTEPMTLSKSSEIMVRTMASVSRSWRLHTHPVQWRTRLPGLSLAQLTVVANQVDLVTLITSAKMWWMMLSEKTRETSSSRLRVWLTTSQKRWASRSVGNWAALEPSAKLTLASLELVSPSLTTFPTLNRLWVRWVSDSIFWTATEAARLWLSESLLWPVLKWGWVWLLCALCNQICCSFDCCLVLWWEYYPD